MQNQDEIKDKISTNMDETKVFNFNAEKLQEQETQTSSDEKIEKQKELYRKKEDKKKKRKKIAIIIAIMAFVLLIFSIIFAVININNDKIIGGISINGIEVSGLQKDEAKEKIRKVIDENKAKEIALKHDDFETQVNTELIEVNYDIDRAVEDAFNIGRNSNIFVNNYSILFTLLGKKEIKINVSLNEDELKKTVKDASSKLPGAMKEASYYIEDDNLVITKGTKGLVIDEKDTIDRIKNNLNTINEKTQDFIDLKIVEQEPKPIDIENIYKEVHQEAKDAYYTKEPFEIFPEVNGIDFNVEEAKKILEEDKNEYTIKLTITKPSVTIEQIGTEAFPDRLAVFTTRYDASNVNRTTNLRLACEKINGTVVLAGDTFSYNKTIGERTIAAGYKEAAIYAAGEVVDGLGGGICQISSTLYNAVVMANLEVVERRNHQFVTSYLPAGRDATVVYGVTDFQFKNTRKYPIRLTASVQNGIATIEVFGIKEDEEYTITFETRTVGTVPFSTKYVDDDSLNEGEEVVKQNGANGLQTETYIIKNLDGKVTRELLSKDTYTPMQKIVKKGTKTVVKPETTTTENKKEEKPVETTKTKKQEKKETVEKTNTQSTNKKQ